MKYLGKIVTIKKTLKKIFLVLIFFIIHPGSGLEVSNEKKILKNIEKYRFYGVVHFYFDTIPKEKKLNITYFLSNHSMHPGLGGKNLYEKKIISISIKIPHL